MMNFKETETVSIIINIIICLTTIKSDSILLLQPDYIKNIISNHASKGSQNHLAS